MKPLIEPLYLYIYIYIYLYLFIYTYIYIYIEMWDASHVLGYPSMTAGVPMHGCGIPQYASMHFRRTGGYPGAYGNASKYIQLYTTIYNYIYIYIQIYIDTNTNIYLISTNIYNYIYTYLGGARIQRIIFEIISKYFKNNMSV